MKATLLFLSIFIFSIIGLGQPYSYSYEFKTNYTKPRINLCITNEALMHKDYVEMYVDDYEKLVEYIKTLKTKVIEYDSIYDANDLNEKIIKYFDEISFGNRQFVEGTYVNNNKKSKLEITIGKQTTNYTYVENDYKFVIMTFKSLEEIDKFINFYNKENLVNSFNDLKNKEDLFD